MTMFASILMAVALSRGIPAQAITGEDLVIVVGRPGCYVQALYHDPTMPVVVCDSPMVKP